jgi:hypothetical protein
MIFGQKSSMDTRWLPTQKTIDTNNSAWVSL